jgi:RNA polymerase sigma-70 factor (ECF subfamily)
MRGSHNTLKDELVLVKLAIDEPSAFARLYDHYFPIVFKYVLYRVCDAQAADDISSMIFERVLLGIANYRPKQAPFRAWLFGMAHHVVSDHFRYQSKHRWHSLDALKNMGSNDPPPEEVAISNELNDRLLEALGCLTDRQRDLIALKVVAGLNNRQIARLTEMSESNVGVTFYRTIRKLRNELKENGVIDG